MITRNKWNGKIGLGVLSVGEIRGRQATEENGRNRMCWRD